VAERGYVVVPPYDDAAVIAGQGTVGLEIAEDFPGVEVVLVPVSGGGLISGVAAAVKALCPGVKVVGVEPALAADAQESLRAGRLIGWDARRAARTSADGLRVARLGTLPWEHVRALVDDIVTVSEDQIVAAVALLASGARLVAEPSGAVTTAAYEFHRAGLPVGRTVAIVSGGNIAPAELARLLRAAGPDNSGG
jgi:threonine dehydratase